MCATNDNPLLRADELSVLRIVEDTVVDGPGIRTAVYCAGCRHRCPGCHNPQSWDFAAGTVLPVKEVVQRILAAGHTGVTFSGGDPMYQAEGFAQLARALKVEEIRDIWCYTGFLFEQAVASPAMKKLLSYVDVLVDGPFLESRKNPELLFRGSDNQRLIDVPRSLRQGETVLFRYDPRPHF